MLSRILLSSLYLALVCPAVLAQGSSTNPKNGLGNDGKANLPVSYPHKEIEYVDSMGTCLPSAIGARYRRETMYRDAKAGTVKRFYLSGKLCEYTAYASIPDEVRHGVRMVYYETGQISVSERYSASLLEGERLMYYPTGVVKRRDLFDKGVRTKGEYFMADGASAAYVEAEEWPVYETGGLAEIVAAIQRAAYYPRMAQAQNIEGKVFVAFSATETGEITDIRVVRGINLLNESAIKAVKSLHRFAKPGRVEGKAVKIGFTLPVTCLIR